MELFVDDAGYARAPASLVYRRITDVGSWPLWWRGVRVRRLGTSPSAGGQSWLLVLPGGWASRIRVRAEFHGWRHDTGVAFRLSGDLEGDAEFWLEPLDGGTVVHHLFVGRTPLRPSRRIHERYRRSVRRGLWGLKDALHLEVRTMAGLRP